MKQRIILISGFAGSGKTITGELLQEKFDNCARVESDFLILVKPFVRGEQLSKLKIENAAAIVANFIQHGYESILAVGTVWNQLELDLFLEKFPNNEILIFWLDSSKELRFSRAAKRQDPGDDSESMEKTEASLGGYPELPLRVRRGKFYTINVDENKSPETIVDEILKELT